MILFVQPFGLGSPGGGSRIFRALLENAPEKWLSVAATPNPTPPPPFGQEIHVSGRPYFGRLEKTRFTHWFQYLNKWSCLRLYSKFDRLIKERRISAVHAIAHSCWDTAAAFKAAKQNNIPFFLSVHDDPVYLLQSDSLRKFVLPEIAKCWREADARFVISEEMGQELCRRWGKKDYILVTDGLKDIAKQPRRQTPDRLSVYFMGLLHISYEPNFVALQKALHIISEQKNELKVSLTLRGATLRREAVIHPELFHVLPFGNESEVQSDLENVDVLYQPLSLDPTHQPMNAYSLSTKMITYLGSGLPILFHGPSDSAAGKILEKNQAAFVCDSNDPRHLAKILSGAAGHEHNQVVLSALKLATKQFRLNDVCEKFWKIILGNISKKDN